MDHQHLLVLCALCVLKEITCSGDVAKLQEDLSSVSMWAQRPYLIAVNYAEFRGTAKLGNA